MIRSRLGLKALVLSGLVFGLMAFAASGAQASEWYYLEGSGATLKLLAMGDLLPTLGATFETGGGTLELTTKGGTLLKVNCTALQVNGKLKEGGKSTEGTVKFSGCEAFLNNETKASTKCVPETAGTKLVVETKQGLVLVALHEDPVTHVVTTTALVEPETGTVDAVFGLGATCSVAEEVEVKGDLTLEDCNNEFTVHKVAHLVKEHKTLHGLTALGVPATLEGSAFVFLTGVHEGLLWAGLHF
jgi:hypothetical protein